MKALQKRKHWLTGREAEPESQEITYASSLDPLWEFIENENARFESFGVEGYSYEEMWRIYIRARIRRDHGMESVLEAIRDICEPKERQAAECRRMEYLSHRLRKHAQRFPVSHSGHESFWQA
jgi:hypothetical protein